MNSQTTESENAIAVTKPPPLIWVRDDHGVPRVLWLRVLLFVFFYVCVNLLISWILGMVLSLSIEYVTTFISSCGMLIYLTLAIEMQRQLVLTGHPKFRFSINAVLAFTIIVACFFALVANVLRESRLGHEANQAQKAQLEEVMDGGFVSIGSVRGNFITCQISRPSFSDLDLAKLIELSSIRTPGTPQLSFLAMEASAVSDSGIRKLATCQQLRHLYLPSVSLSEETLSALEGLPNLQYLLLDETKITPQQLAGFYRKKPKLFINGKRSVDRR